MAMQKYSLKDIAHHDGIDHASVWIIINNSVYDVTNFLDEHPGGKDLILEHAGKDATKDFKNVGHSSDANKILERYFIGELDEEDRQVKPKSGANIVSDNTTAPLKRSIFCCC